LALLLVALAVTRLPGDPPPEPTTEDARPAVAHLKEEESPEPPIKPAANTAGDTDKEKKSAPAAQPGANKLESLKVPSDAVIVICDALADALRLVPNAVVLRPEKYKELQEQIEKLKAQVAQLSAEKPVAPSTCKLTGKVEGDRAHLKAQFVFVTDRPNVGVFLACGQAQIDNPRLDDRPAQIRYEAEGYTVQVDRPGDHRLSLDLTLKLLPRNAGRGLELDLPRAAGTALELDLPNDVKENDLRVYDQGLAGTLLTYKQHQLSGLLSSADKRGPADKLDLSWKEVNAVSGVKPVLIAEGRVQVRIDPQQIITEAELILKARGGPTREWRFLVPPGAEVKVAPADADRARPLKSEDLLNAKKAKVATRKTLVLKEPETDPIVVQITVYGPAPQPGSPVPIGPFLVQDAFQQYGSVVISNSVTDLRPRFQPHGFIAPRDLTEEERRRNVTAAFSYWNLPALRDLPQATPGSLSLLDVEGDRVRGQIEARLDTRLLLSPGNAEGELLWRVVTVIDVKPVRTEADHLDVLIPPEWAYDDQRSPGAPDRVRGVEYDAAKGVVRFNFVRATADALKPFQLTVEALHRQRAGTSGHQTLQLPRPLDALDPGGPVHLVTVRAGKSVELLTREGSNRALEWVSRETHEQTWKARRFPERLEVEWGPYRPEVRADMVVDLTLSPRAGHVRHTVRLQFPQEPLAQIALQVPEALADRIHLEGGVFAEGLPRPGGRQVKLREPVGKEHTLTLEYSFALPDPGTQRSGEVITLPLVTLDAAVVGETKVRVGSDAGILPALAGGPWEETSVEGVKGWNRLPSLVVRAPRVDQRLALRLAELPGGAPSSVLIDRVLVRAVVLVDGSQSYRVSFLISQLTGRSLDVELPAPVLRLGPRVTLDGQAVTGAAVDEDGKWAEGGRFLRLKLPEISRRAAVLEVTYQIPAGQAGGGFLQSVLTPPAVRDDPGKTPARWQIGLPAGWVVLGPETGPGVERTWVRRGWLLAPRLTTTSADLERWFAGAEPPGRDEEGEGSTPTLVCWRSGLESLTVAYAPQQAWLMVCSLGLLLVGFALYLLARPREAGRGLSTAWLMPALTALVLAGAVVGLLWPTALAAVVFGCEPGAAVLLVFAGVQWLLHERYRRQIVFLPSFSRGHNGSSLLRATGSAQRPRGEPSTVDAPPYTGSSLWPTAEGGPAAPPGSGARRSEPQGEA
jgi:hypothetical protein